MAVDIAQECISTPDRGSVDPHLDVLLKGLSFVVGHARPVPSMSGQAALRKSLPMPAMELPVDSIFKIG